MAVYLIDHPSLLEIAKYLYPQEIEEVRFILKNSRYYNPNFFTDLIRLRLNRYIPNATFADYENILLIHLIGEIALGYIDWAMDMVGKAFDEYLRVDGKKAHLLLSLTMWRRDTDKVREDHDFFHKNINIIRERTVNIIREIITHEEDNYIQYRDEKKKWKEESREGRILCEIARGHLNKLIYYVYLIIDDYLDRGYDNKSCNKNYDYFVDIMHRIFPSYESNVDCYPENIAKDDINYIMKYIR